MIKEMFNEMKEVFINFFYLIKEFMQGFIEDSIDAFGDIPILKKCLKEDNQHKIKFERKREPLSPFHNDFSGFSYNYLIKHAKTFDWDFISRYYDLDEYTIHKLQDYLNWHNISIYQQMRKEFIEELADKVDWDMIFKYQECVDEDFLRKHEDKWLNRKSGFISSEVLKNIKMSESFIREYRKVFGWEFMFENQKVSINLLREFKDEIDWNDVVIISRLCFKKKFSDYHLEEFKDYIGWDNLSTLSNLSGNFLSKYKEKINWDIFRFCGSINFLIDSNVDEVN